jgi:hypothetical protein
MRDDQAAAQARRRDRRRAAFHEAHRGHDVGTRSNGAVYCRTCVRPDTRVDQAAVDRAVAGDPPASLNAAERELAIVQLRGVALTFALIAARVGCSASTARQVYHRHMRAAAAVVDHAAAAA